ncbi:MAG: hypothetical protein IT472_08195 [Thermomonas sp.]|uniref:hypothetical protein n=1 Tax=Thermomonas sp. TaxID=1971895 RepID=UPI0026050C6A|nr:hypothetical protein [Thermomonas sp.]MCC7097144.1 hypothetical protein [Thermomonas sp.]
MNARIHATLGVVIVGLLLPLAAHSVDSAYRKKLERSGCTQASELQGCDINKTKEENARAGFGTAPKPAPKPVAAAKSPYAGQWVAKAADGRTVSTIRVDPQERVWVSGKSVAAKRSDGALVFKSGFITYTIQGDRRLKGQDRWHNSDAGTSGAIVVE